MKRQKIVMFILVLLLVVLLGCLVICEKIKLNRFKGVLMEEGVSIDKKVTQDVGFDKISSSSIVEKLPVWPVEKFSEGDYVNWKTYINEKLGYTIKYPADWNIDACDIGCASKEVIINPPDAEMFTSYISIGLDGGNIEKTREGIKRNTTSVVERKVSFSGKDSYQFKYPNMNDYQIILVVSGDKLFGISTSRVKNLQVVKALASLKFVE